MESIANSEMKIRISFPNGIRGDLVDEELIAKMKRAGVYHIGVGIETLDDEMRKKIGKSLDMKAIDTTIEMAAKYGISVAGFFMLGFPGETKEQMLKTIDYAVNSKLNTVILSRVIPFKGTKLYDEAMKAGFAVSNEPDDFDTRFGRINLSAVADREFDRLFKLAYLRFYFSVRRIMSLYRIFPEKRTLFRQFFRLVFWKE
jgi:radical SAM superfamily enzyme YgiQ (UPF0313 family)